MLSLSNVLAYDTPSTDSLLWDWVSLDSAAIATFSPLLSPEQITATRWVSDSVLTNGFGSADVSNALNALPGVLMETRGMEEVDASTSVDRRFGRRLPFRTPCCLSEGFC